LANIKEIKRLRGGDLQVAAQANVQIDAEIGQKDHFRMEAVIISGWILGGLSRRHRHLLFSKAFSFENKHQALQLY